MSNYVGMLNIDLGEVANTLRNAGVPTIRLSDFSQGFWLAFTGRVEDPEYARQLLAWWVQRIAGNASTSVDVVDDVTGEPIARIPPVLSAGNTSNLITLFEEIKDAREQAQRDSVLVAGSRLVATKEQIIKKYQHHHLKDTVNDWITLYTLIEGTIPEGADIDIGEHLDTASISPETLKSLEWE